MRPDHPQWAIRILAALEREFPVLYSPIGRPLDAAEEAAAGDAVAGALSIRSEGPLMERLEYDLPFRWFVGIAVEDVA